MTTESKLPIVLLLMLTGIVLLLMAAIIGLFVPMNQLQEAVLAALAAPLVVRVFCADLIGRHSATCKQCRREMWRLRRAESKLPALIQSVENLCTSIRYEAICTHRDCPDIRTARLQRSYRTGSDR